MTTGTRFAPSSESYLVPGRYTRVMVGLSLEQVLLRVVAALIVAGVLGGVQGTVATMIGDRGPAHAGRASFSPFSHLGGFGFLAFLVAGVGWIRSIDLRTEEPRWSRQAGVVMAVAGVAAALALGALAIMLRGPVLQFVPGQAAFTVVRVLNVVGQVAVVTGILNLIPLPPLAAGAIWSGWLPSLARRLAKAEPFLAGFAFAALWFSSLSGALGTVKRHLLDGFGF